ncbi:MAG TPA: dihydrolipoamide acetyltransferase family protein [Acidimicrobiia bacterium]|nr:dihydrolipoamide acetyltransferase family protein [Acidimicrobiia bacterium]
MPESDGIFRMPALGADMESGTVLEWLVHPGDTVHRGDLVAVVHTDKADIEVEIFEDGEIGELLVPVGQEVEVGTPLATLVGARSSPAPSAASPPIPEAPTPAPSRPEPAQPASPARGERVVASPYARRRALELGVDLASVAPSTPGQPITTADIEKTAAPSPRASVDQAAAMRRSIGNLMARSKREIPHYYLEHDIELGHPLVWLRQHNENVPIDQRVLPAALLCKAVALAAEQMPALNGFWRGDTFEPGAGVHLGVAIALRGGGLVAPAIRDANELTLAELMTRLRDLSGRARGGRLRGSEMTDATITVTNLGDQGVRAVFGVIYAPQVALVGFGKIADRVWAAEDSVGVRPVVSATLSADHRATDGHLGARFLALVERLLHQPEKL